MPLTLIVLNNQGASEEYRNLHDIETCAQVVVAQWGDPENLTARIFDGNTLVYEGPATKIPVPRRPNRFTSRGGAIRATCFICGKRRLCVTFTCWSCTNE